MQVIFQVRVGGCRHLEHDLAAAAADVLDKLPAAEAKDLTSAMQQQTTSRES